MNTPGPSSCCGWAPAQWRKSLGLWPRAVIAAFIQPHSLEWMWGRKGKELGVDLNCPASSLPCLSKRSPEETPSLQSRRQKIGGLLPPALSLPRSQNPTRARRPQRNTRDGRRTELLPGISKGNRTHPHAREAGTAVSSVGSRGHCSLRREPETHQTHSFSPPRPPPKHINSRTKCSAYQDPTPHSTQTGPLTLGWNRWSPGGVDVMCE